MKQLDTPAHLPVRDAFLWLYVYPVLALAVVHMGNDTPLRQLIILPSYYTDILFALGTAYLIGLYIRKINWVLNTNLTWQAVPHKRFYWQLFLGIICPVFFLFLAEWFYLFWLRIPLHESSIFYYELPLCTIFLFFINGIYYLLQLNTTVAASQQTITESLTDPITQLPSYLSTYVVTAGYTTRPIASNQIACFFTESKTIYLVTTDAQKFVIKESLDEIIQKLDPEIFFRLNRWVIVHRQSIQSIEHTPTRKLKIHLSIAIGEDIFVSKERATLFLNWFEQ
ncbi:LytTR family DNA-binding domain-containing protein [Cytophagaceae bacterium DM2B3-1]|uniref:LytTR family DNA-binding domain-containing protein n=1 Tax=Xanthocytophaga flava TaxID=3048013 RepID=A0ABT7CEK9_9BACT|nr:LytTR family DNA-binding domain-containing protein [Xanthocytophaga flavus]MDJ1492130.1 LytTR family DNA-binding domain-containing protein [Xanthocytophaga flavus]